MYRFLLFAFCLIFSANTEEQIVSIQNMCGKDINLYFNESNYDLSFSSIAKHDANFFPINIDKPFGIGVWTKLYIKMTKNVSYNNSDNCVFWIDGYPETRIPLILNWYNIIGKGYYLDKYYIANCKDKNSFAKYKIVIVKYSEDSSRNETLSYRKFGQVELNLHRKPLCNIQ